MLSIFQQKEQQELVILYKKVKKWNLNDRSKSSESNFQKLPRFQIRSGLKFEKREKKLNKSSKLIETRQN